MKQLFLTLLLLSTSFLSASGIDFETNFNKAKKRAAEENKMIFVDVMASWCGPCKAMEKDVFTNSDVATFFNENFINVQLDESRNKSFLKKYGIKAYPTLIFFDSDLGCLFKCSGGANASSLVDLGSAMLELQKFKDLETPQSSDIQVFHAIVNEVTPKISKKKAINIIHRMFYYLPKFRSTLLENYMTSFDISDCCTLKHIAQSGEPILSNDKIRDQLGIKLLCGNGIPKLSEIKHVGQQLIDLKFENANLSSVYLTSFFANNFVDFLDANLKSEKIATFGKNLIVEYPHCWDKQMLLSTFQYLTFENLLDKETYEKIINNYDLVPLDKWTFVTHDIYAFALSKLGKIEEAVAHVSRANELAVEGRIKYRSTISLANAK